MRILYMSVHEILEYDEVKLFSELGHSVHSLGAYTMPGGADHRKRPPLDNLPYSPHFIELATRYGKELHPEQLEMVDMVIIMHEPEFVEKNWDVLKPWLDRGGRVVWRSIGQSVPSVEHRLARFRAEGMQIVRYSPNEDTIPDNNGSDAMIRFYKDPDEYVGWRGNEQAVVNFTQSLEQRARFTGYDTIKEVSEGLPFKVYGPGNEGLGHLAGGLLSYDEQMAAMRSARVFFYTGTYPASYTLSFIEAWMMGIPVVAVGPALGNGEMFPFQKTYEVADLLTDRVNGYISDNPNQLRYAVGRMLADADQAKFISERGRARAIEIFGKATIAEQWQRFING